MTAGVNTSGTFNFGPALCDVIITAYGRCGVRRTQLTPEHLFDAVAEANLMQSDWSNDQVNLWTVEQIQQPLTAGQATYDVDPWTVMILAAWISTGDAPEKDRIIVSVDRDTYAAFPDKETPASPSQYWFNQTIRPTITLWQPPDDGGPYTLKYFRARQMHDALLPDEQQPEVPYRFLDAYVAGLSWRVAMHYAPQMAGALKSYAQECFDKAKKRDVEKTSLRIVPAMSIYTNAVYAPEVR